ncbi:C40 family peptidase [Prochlorococcus sp. MIT 1300]|uniref:C40 family peptidase n=1 Tax=Prochlorococcus sp. MIT 1300 TaxID=3096218 RepID=UPI002A74FD40|nr:C40 family peptidase [Prochlorococcus sp. MIT 1300]
MKRLGSPIERHLIVCNSYWQLKVGVNGYENSTTHELATQVLPGRTFRVIEAPDLEEGKTPAVTRVRVNLMEDGYLCWLDLAALFGSAFQIDIWNPVLFSKAEIYRRLPAVLHWVESAAKAPNQYLWGGSIGPDFDCSGLVQTAFASQSIWLPRDAYQQEGFCTQIPVAANDFSLLRPCDLLFFGSKDHCDHVALYRGDGYYLHSSGREYGRNGIGCDGLHPKDNNPIANHYRARLRGVGRVERCHDGTTLS